MFLDADGDGWQDLLLVNSTNWPGHQTGPKSVPALYRNNHNGTFTDVTRGSGLDVELYGIGGAAADFDNDGRIDVYVTALGGNRLFRNMGAGRFADVTAAAGVADGGFSTSALWFDYDNDGRLDLFVAHYVDWSIEKDLFCTLDGKNKSYCTPESYKGQSADAVPQSRGRHVRGRDEERGRCTTRRPKGSASRCSISTATAGSICSSPTTRSRTGCIGTTATGRSRTWRSAPASRSARRASHVPAWASTPPTTTDRDARA